jgi:hypothetical protein
MPMTPNAFRRMALGLPDAAEGAHMGHPDFRAHGRIFASLGGPGEEYAMVKLTTEQQHDFVASRPDIFVPVKGGWGLRGATNIRLEKATASALRPALEAAWGNAAPKKRRAEEVPRNAAPPGRK